MTQPTTEPIFVSSRVLRHISRGIYRTPAGALKELVSNAYDAGASEATIKTGWPAFSEIVVSDNGQGMTVDEFRHLVKNIGLSSKTVGQVFRVPALAIDRVTIGHYGIGLLAVGQLASTMTIRSKKAGSTRGFRAELDFEQFEVKHDAGIARSEIIDEAGIEEQEQGTTPNGTAGRGISLGTCKVWPERYAATESTNSFTKITLSNLRAQTVAKLRGTLRDRQNPQAMLWQDYSATYADLLRLLREQEGKARQGIYPYEQLVWELGMYCPLAYPSVGAFQSTGELADIAAIASSTGFVLKMDGMEILKPVEQYFFDDEHYKYSQVFRWCDEVYDFADRNEPKVSGYVIFKPQIRPKAMQGILVRESGVAVGTYDSTYLQYPFNEGQKFNQLTGELFATGLSGALNIDRNSFNETDDRYLRLAEWFHNKLRDEVFPAIKRLQSGPAAKRRLENQAFLRVTITELASRLNKKRSVKLRSLGSDAPLLTLTGDELTINKDHPDGKGSGVKREKVLLAAAFVLAGYVKPAELAKIEKLITDAKREGRTP